MVRTIACFDIVWRPSASPLAASRSTTTTRCCIKTGRPSLFLIHQCRRSACTAFSHTPTILPAGFSSGMLRRGPTCNYPPAEPPALGSAHQGEPLQQLLRQHRRLHIEHFPSYAPGSTPMKGFGLGPNVHSLIVACY